MIKKIITLIIVMALLIPPQISLIGSNAVQAEDNQFDGKLDKITIEAKKQQNINREKLVQKENEDGYIVKFKDNTPDKKKEQILGKDNSKSLKLGDKKGNFHRVSKKFDIATLKNNPNVEYVEKDELVYLTQIPNDTLYTSSQWNLPMINAPNGWDITTGSNAVRVAVIDSGLDYEHPDFNLTNITQGWNFIFNEADTYDSIGHGTKVAGIIGAWTNNEIGIAGVCWNVQLVPLHCFGDNGSAYKSDIIAAIYKAVDVYHCKIINISSGSLGYSKSYYEAVQYAKQNDVIVVTGAGNDGNTNDFYPAGYSDCVIAVGSVNSSETVSWFSQRSNVFVTAPGEGIITTSYTTANINNVLITSYDYTIHGGTSFSAPHVSGLAALIATIKPEITFDQMKNLLKNTSKDLGAVGYDNDYGYGLIDVGKALQATLASSECSIISVTNPTSVSVNANTISAAVLNETASMPVDVTVSNNATWKLYSNLACTTEIAGNVMNLSVGNNTAYIKVTAEDFITSKIYTLTITRNASQFGDFTFGDNGSTISITNYTGTGGAVTIPSVINGKPVTSIGGSAFYECTSLTSITIPNSVTQIGSYAFYNCTGLTSVNIPDSVTIIGDNSFAFCANLAIVTILGNVTTIGNFTFQYCTSLTSITIPISVSSIGAYSFSGCSKSKLIIKCFIDSYAETFAKNKGYLYLSSPAPTPTPTPTAVPNVPTVKIIANDTATGVDVVVKLSGDITNLAGYEIYVGYDKTKVNAVTPITAVAFTDWAITKTGYPTKTPAFNNVLGVTTVAASKLNVVEGSDLTIATMSFTKIAGQTVDANTFFQGAFKPVATIVYTNITCDAGNISQKTTPSLVSHSFVQGHTISGIVGPLNPYYYDNPDNDEILTELQNAFGKSSIELYDENLENVIKSTTVEVTSNPDGLYTLSLPFELTGVTDGTYILAMSRSGMCTKLISITVSGNDINIGTKQLLGCDINQDLEVTPNDVLSVLALFSEGDNDYGGAGYNIFADINGDGQISPNDVLACLDSFVNFDGYQEIN